MDTDKKIPGKLTELLVSNSRWNVEAAIRDCTITYFFEGAATDQNLQVGNAVPPYLAKQIAGVVNSVLSGASK